MTNIKKRWLANHAATISGIIVALSQAWITIDWITFDMNKEWPKLVLSGMIALGGYMSSFNIKQK